MATSSGHWTEAESFNNSIITTNQINGAYHEITKEKKKVYQGDIIGEGNANNIAYHS